jgi:sugar lactone lactonase YvrE
MTNAEVKWITDDFFRLAESPLWDELNNRLFWVDIPAGNVHALNLNDGRRVHWHFDGPVGSLGLAQSGRLVIAIAGNVHLFDIAREELVLLVALEPDYPVKRLNDGKVGPDGAFWVGSMDDRPAKEEIGVLYRVTADGRAERKIEGFRVSNGLAWSNDAKVMFHSDSRGPWIDSWHFDEATGEISGRVRLRTLSEAEGRPDGAACDGEGGYWSCGVSAGCLNRFGTDGALLARIDVPVAAPTMLCFAGRDMRTAFITSLREGLNPEKLADHPNAGRIFAIDLGVAGVPIHRFADQT